MTRSQHTKGEMKNFGHVMAPSESASTPYLFKEGPSATFVDSCKAKRRSDTGDPLYVTAEMATKKAKLASSSLGIDNNTDISKGLFQCHGFTGCSIQENVRIEDRDIHTYDYTYYLIIICIYFHCTPTDLRLQYSIG